MQNINNSTCKHYLLVIAAVLTAASTQAIAQGYSLTATPSSVNAGQTIQVCWTAPAGGTTTSDWIGMYRDGASNFTYFNFLYNSTAATSGCFNFVAPGIGGVIEFRYLLNNLYTDIATSNPVTVLCTQDGHCHDSVACSIDKCVSGVCQNPDAMDAAVELTASATQAAIHRTITACWDAAAHVTSTNDWIGLYKVGAVDTAYISFLYTGGGASGCLNFTAGPDEGDYEFRYFVQGGYCEFAASEVFDVCDATLSPSCACLSVSECNDEDPCTADSCTATVCANVGPNPDLYSLSTCPEGVSPGGPVEVCWTAPEGSSHSDWVGLYAADAPSLTYVSFVYTQGVTDGCATLDAPSAPGTYEFRYLLGGGYCSSLIGAPWMACEGCAPADLAAAFDMVDCLRGPATPVSSGCETLDLDCDDNIDLYDASLFQIYFAGP